MKIVFLDIDGTLFHHEIGIPHSAIEAIHKARANGHRICVCTGRPRPDVDEQITSIGFDGLICSCGSYVEIQDQVIYQEVMPVSLLKQLHAQLQEQQIGYNLEGIHNSFLDAQAMEIFINMFAIEQGMNSELARNYMNAIHMNSIDMITEADWNQICKISVFAKDPEAFTSIRSQLGEHLHFVMHPLSGSDILNGEISLSHITKATGIDHVLSHYRMSQSDAIAIGDSMNDAEMLKHCHIGICMDNGADALKAISDEICPAVDQDGIYVSFLKHALI